MLAGCAATPAPVVVSTPMGCRPGPAADPAAAVRGDPGLRDPRVTDAVVLADGSVVVAYRPRLELGMSIRDPAGRWRQLLPSNAPMRSAKVRNLVLDATGGVWCTYADGAAGVSRVSGTVLETWLPANSALPTADVGRIYAEPEGAGPGPAAVWCVSSDGLTRWTPGNVWTHFGRSHGQATEALRLLGLDDWLTRAVVGITDLVAGGGSVWVATPRLVYRFDGTVFAPLPDDGVRGLSDLRYDRVLWAAGCAWVTLRNRESRRVESVARWQPGAAGWTLLGLEAAGITPTEFVTLADCGERAWLTSAGWRGRALVAGAGDPGWRRVEPGAIE